MEDIDTSSLKKSLEVLRAITHPVRMSILAFIDKNKVINVNKIYGTLKLEQSITSQHLRILRSVDIVNTKRDGKYIFYSINYEKLKTIVSSIDDFFKSN